MLNLNLPKQSYVFLRKHLEENVYQVSAVSASDGLKRNTDFVCAFGNIGKHHKTEQRTL